jgi:hypothetical protein
MGGSQTATRLRKRELLATSPEHKLVTASSAQHRSRRFPTAKGVSVPAPYPLGGNSGAAVREESARRWARLASTVAGNSLESPVPSSLFCGMRVPLLPTIMLATTGFLPAAPTGNRAVIEKMPGLVAFWTFAEEAGQPRVSSGTREKHPLTEVGGPIARVEGGPFSGYAAELSGKEYLKIPYAETGDLNISGPAAQVSMFAAVRIVNLKQSRTIAGMWSEGKGANDDSGTRQYALLMNMPTYGGPDKLVPHISDEGGVSRRADGSAFPWCCDYAVTAHEVPTGVWCTLGFTYDGHYLRAYINGVLDELKLDPVVHKRTDTYFTREGPGGGDRGMNPYYHGRGIFRYDPAKHAQAKPGGGSDFTVGARYAVGKMLGEATLGRFGGLAVFNRSLSDAEMMQLHSAANLAALK